MAPSQRLSGVDAARAIALLGMMTVHIWPRYEVDGGPLSWPFHVFAGRSAALFAVLAGVGLALVSGATVPPRGRRWGRAALATVGRALVILLVGLSLGALPDNRVAVILPYYAVLFVLTIPFFPLRARPLAALALVWAVVVPVVAMVVRPALAPPRLDNVTLDWLVVDPGAVVVEILWTGYYPALPWLAYTLAGMAIGRLPLRDPTMAPRLAVAGAALAAGAWGLSQLLLRGLGGAEALFGSDAAEMLESVRGGLYGTTPVDSWWWLGVAVPHSSTPLDLLHTIGTATLVLGVFLWLLREPRRLLFPLVATGSMTLTLYSTHVVLLAVGPTFSTPAREYTAHVLLLVTAATLWRTWVGRGPLEWVATQVATTLADLVPSQRAEPQAVRANGPPRA